MWGILEDIGDGICNTVEKVAKAPVQTAIDLAVQPVRDAIDVIDGLSEGELRTMAIARLGADVAGSMALSELIEWYSDND